MLRLFATWIFKNVETCNIYHLQSQKVIFYLVSFISMKHEHYSI